jgi:hypothetical protein
VSNSQKLRQISGFFLLKCKRGRIDLDRRPRRPLISITPPTPIPEPEHGSPFCDGTRWFDKEKDQIADSLRDDDCLISRIHDSDVRKRGLELLAELREGIKTTGFSQKRDTATLEKTYGPATYSSTQLQSEYSVWFDTTQASEEERLREGYATPEDCKLNVLETFFGKTYSTSGELNRSGSKFPNALPVYGFRARSTDVFGPTAGP